MIMLVNISNSSKSMQQLTNDLKALGEEIGVSIHLQHEDVFNAMHRV
jgi:ACT domain-containing protein